MAAKSDILLIVIQRGIFEMEFITIGIVLVPLFMSFFALLLKQNRGARIFIQIFAFLFFLSALYIFLYPMDFSVIPIPSVIWKLLTLIITAAFLIRSLLDRHYEVSVFLFIQSAVLIITEITVSLNEPSPFLHFNHSEKFILVTGAFITAAFVPFMIRHTDTNTMNAMQKKQAAAGVFMLISAFVGLVAAESLMGLFLFWQLCFGANTLFIKASGKFEDMKYRRISLVRQIALTVWLCVNGAVFFSAGYAKISDINMAAGNAAGLFCTLTLITAIILGHLVPGRNMPEAFSDKPVPYAGLSAIILSLLSQAAVLQKLEPLFANLGHNLLSLIILLGAFLMATAAYYALTAQRMAEIPACMVLYTFGWGLAAGFTGKEGLYFTTGYTAVSALTAALLFCLVIAERFAKSGTNTKQIKLIEQTPLISVFMMTGMASFLFVPIYTGLNRVLFIGLLAGYPVSLLVVIASFAVFTTAVFKWVIGVMTTGIKEENENAAIPVSFIIIILVLFLASLGANLLSGSIYKYFLLGDSGYLPAKNMEEYAQLDGGFYLFKSGTGFIYLVLTIAILTVLFVVFNMAKSRTKTEATKGAPNRYTPSVLLPGTINFGNLFRVGFVLIVLLIAGVSLSCLI